MLGVSTVKNIENIEMHFYLKVLYQYKYKYVRYRWPGVSS